MNGGVPELTLAERFRTALDACDRAYARGDATPVVTEVRPRLEQVSQPLIYAAPPMLQPAALVSPQAPTTIVAVPPPANSGSTLRTIAIVAGVVVLAIGAWFVRKRLIEPVFYGRKDSNDDYSYDGKGLSKGHSERTAGKGTSNKSGKGGNASFDATYYDEVAPRSTRNAPRVTFEELPPSRRSTASRPAQTTHGEDVARAQAEAQRMVAARQSALRSLEELAGPEGSDEDGASDDPNFVPL